MKTLICNGDVKKEGEMENGSNLKQTKKESIRLIDKLRSLLRQTQLDVSKHYMMQYTELSGQTPVTL